MSKLADFVCPPVPIAAAEQVAAENRAAAEGLGVGMPTVVLIENLSGVPS